MTRHVPALMAGYRPDFRHELPQDRAVLGTVTLVVIEERIRELWQWRTWDRTHSWAAWTTLRQERTVELRALVKLARQARAIAAPDPLTPERSYHDWQAR